MNHLWQRFLLTSSLVVGLAIGVAATVFGYSNLTTVDVHWSVLHLNAVPLWTVAVVPLVLVLVAGTLYHWMDGLHHFTEHMRHRRRVHELEAEVASLRAHLDQVLEMPAHIGTEPPKKPAVSLPAADEAMADLATAEMVSAPVAPYEPAEATTSGDEIPQANGSADAGRRSRSRKRVTLADAVPADAATETAAEAVSSTPPEA